jgi:hypothetical protein
MDVVMADLGSVAVSVNNRTTGFGSIEQRMNERAKTGFTQLDIATNIDAGKLLPKQVKISLPVFAGINKTQENPEFDAIVVDEVQDVLRGPSDDASWFDLIDTALLGGIADGTYRLFGDMKNQNFYREDSDRSLAGAAQRLGQPVVLDLRINCRNPRLVGRRAAAVGQLTPGYERFLRPGNTSSLVVLETSDVAPQIDVLAFVLGDLKDQGYSPSEIVVLSMQAGDQSSAAKLEKQSRARYGLSKYFIQEPEDVRVVRYDSIMKFKGLEAPVVIVTDITSLDDQSREILYCGMTRALDKCLVILDKGLKAALVQD